MYKLQNLITEIRYYIRNFIEKRKYGSNHDECFNLDFTITQFILPKLKRYRHYIKEFKSYPNDLNSSEEWISVIDKMIEAFEIVSQFDYETEEAERLEMDYSEYIESSNYKEKESRKEEGLFLFAKYYQSLWL